ncbi:hypothetical protein GH714_014380 [Hevea brasiliensis]|uniref:Transmembrane protein n=1 Tax=Hevea brasiliensis TaxID=3981 RepID=A0A6A6KPV0_HEVBR|nr:hypothetical protein GH714_014380 [Hevea brasiliensis]
MAKDPAKPSSSPPTPFPSSLFTLTLTLTALPPPDSSPSSPKSPNNTPHLRSSSIAGFSPLLMLLSQRYPTAAGSPDLPFGLSSYDMSSLRDRTKDILSVVVALLFGVGCGALTAATMYLVWSLFSTRYDYRYEEFDSEDGDEEDDVSPKKMGYVKIPEADSMPKQVKEVV